MLVLNSKACLNIYDFIFLVLLLILCDVIHIRFHLTCYIATREIWTGAFLGFSLASNLTYYEKVSKTMKTKYWQQLLLKHILYSLYIHQASEPFQESNFGAEINRCRNLCDYLLWRLIFGIDFQTVSNECMSSQTKSSQMLDSYACIYWWNKYHSLDFNSFCANAIY